MGGDFNAHSFTWGLISSTFRTNSRGNILDNLLTSNNNLTLLNIPGISTHLNSTSGSLSAIDLCFSSSSLSPKLTWSTHPDLCDSDHFPILIQSQSLSNENFSTPSRWLINKANWDLFYDLTSNTSSLPDPSNCSTALQTFTKFITDSAESSIPRSSGKKKPNQVPWWSNEIQLAIKNRKKALRTYNSTRTQSDLILYKKARAKARVLVRSGKKQSWSTFVAGLNHPVSISTMWRDIKKLTGNGSFRSISQLKTDHSITSDPLLISEILAKHYTSVSSNANYDSDFLEYKLQQEKFDISFDPPSNEPLPYNLPISENELSNTINKNLRNASPGLDNIHAAMIKNLHPNSLTYLLSLFNSIFSQNTYPIFWKTVIILPILKPGSDPLLPASYRPIALSSVLGKLFQKILNKRLLWYLESNNILSPFQYGFRKGRNTIQPLYDLQSQINDVTNNKSSLYSIFFDLQEAFPRVWRHLISTELYEIGLRGHLPNILQTFLNDRTLLVRINNITSPPLSVQNGVPQGEVFSVLLFLIAINDITKCVNPPSPSVFSLMTITSLSVQQIRKEPTDSYRIPLTQSLHGHQKEDSDFLPRKPTQLFSKKEILSPPYLL